MERDEKWVTYIKEARLNPQEIKIPAYTAINKAKKVKYFDENGILQICKIEEGLGKIAGIMKRDDGSYYVSLFERDFIGTQNATLFHKATAAVKEGMSMVDFLKLCEDVRLVAKEKKVDPLDKYIKYIDAPSVERSADNPDVKSFDFVRVHLTLNDKTENIKEELEMHFPEIHRRALKRIEESGAFKRHKSLINDLVLSPPVKLYQNSIELIFVLKK